MRFNSTIVLNAGLAALVVLNLSSAEAAKPVVTKNINGIVIANSTAADPAARQIVRNVASETLKTISTKDSFENPKVVSVVEPLEDFEPSLPAKVVIEDAPGVRAPAAAAVPAPAQPVSQKATIESVSAEKAQQWLENGNKRYLKKAYRTDGKAQADRDRLKKGQHPHAIILSCSDSRVPPETVFDQSLGEVFVVRTAGENLDASVIASLEYAVEHLGPRLLVVMGHTSCGAVAAALAAKDGESAGSPSLDQLVSDIKPRLPNRDPAAAPSDSLEIETRANAHGVAADLMKRSSIIRARVEKGDLVIKPALYHLESGAVNFD